MATCRAFVKGSPRCRRPPQPCRVTARHTGLGWAGGVGQVWVAPDASAGPVWVAHTAGAGPV